MKRSPSSIFVYLATPIKCDDPNKERSRCQYATAVAGYLQDAGIPLFSPASHGHAINHFSSVRQSWDYYSKIDLPILSTCCTHLVVICADGWEQSTGVASEIMTAGDIGIPVIYFDPATMDKSAILEALDG